MNAKPLNHVLAAIDRLDLDPIRRRLTHERAGKGWAPARAAAAERDYRRYLKLLAKYPALTIAPSGDIDEFWHAHILDTRKYAEDCQATFGEFVHHYPYLGLGDEADQAAQQQAGRALHELYEREFGEPLHVAAASFCARASDSFCARSPEAFCAREPERADGAFCAREPASQAAFCAREPQQGSAFCAREPQQQVGTFCARAPETAPAFCARKPVEADEDGTFCARKPA